MKKKEIEDWRNKNIEELKVALKEAQKELTKLRLESKVKKLKNVRQLFLQRNKIAVLFTLIREKELSHV